MTVLYTHRQTWVVITLPHWTPPNSVVSVILRVSCRMLESNVVLTCDVCPLASRLSTFTDEPMCLVTASCVLLAVLEGSQLGVNPNHVLCVDIVCYTF